MNSKTAKRLRKAVRLLKNNKNLSEENTYQEWALSYWWTLPQTKDPLTGKDTGIVDKKELKRLRDKIVNPKYKQFNGVVHMRYAAGTPCRLAEDCVRYVYKQLKKNYVEVALGAR